MSLRGDFICWYNNEFKTDPLYAAMAETVEASPWHRERNVAIHTDMVVSEYISWADKEWTTETLIGAVACAFHDTGKPSARVVKFKPERGQYNSFGGHEVISARLWEDYAMRNSDRMRALFTFQGTDSSDREAQDVYLQVVYEIGFVIEHHMPYEQPSDKVQDMATTASELFGVYPIFQNHLTADTHGRVADDHEQKIANVDNWIFEFEKKMHVPVHRITTIRDQKTLLLPIGPSGCGKSTHLKRLKKYWGDNLAHYSWDTLRMEWYDPVDYSKAYQMANDDPHFRARYMKVFNELILSGKNIYVDNTNLSRKRRRPWVDAARKHGYNIVAFTFPIALDTVLKRQKSRGDKDVPGDAVRKHYMTLQCPLLGEVDHIEVVNTF